MFNLFIYLCFISMATDVTKGKIINFPEIPKGMSVHNVLTSWEEAYTQCQIEGAVLASPINNELYNIMNAVISASGSTFHIGVKATGRPGEYTSVEGVALEDMIMSTWNELDTLNGDCLTMSSHGSVHTVECETRLPYICYNRHYKNNTNCGPVNKGYKYDMATGNCYKIHTSMKWNEALTTCSDEGGHLAIVNNVKEAQSIHNMKEFTSNWILIGLRQTGSGDWNAISGQPVERLFNDWVIGYKPKGDLHCGAIKKGGKLDDVNCSANVPFICQKTPTP